MSKKEKAAAVDTSPAGPITVEAYGRDFVVDFNPDTLENLELATGKGIITIAEEFTGGEKADVAKTYRIATVRRFVEALVPRPDEARPMGVQQLSDTLRLLLPGFFRAIQELSPAPESAEEKKTGASSDLSGYGPGSISGLRGTSGTASPLQS
jgi:hypothetical protein